MIAIRVDGAYVVAIDSSHSRLRYIDKLGVSVDEEFYRASSPIAVAIKYHRADHASCRIKIRHASSLLGLRALDGNQH